MKYKKSVFLVLIVCSAFLFACGKESQKVATKSVARTNSIKKVRKTF